MHRLSRAATSYETSAGQASRRTDTRTSEIGAPESVQELEVEVTRTTYLGRPRHENAGATEPRRYRRIRKRKKKSLLLLGCLLLGGWLLSSLLLSGHIGLPPSVYF